MSINRKWVGYYAHCTKATPGQLDRQPWYQYENRAVTLQSEQVRCEYGDVPEMEVKVTTEDGKVWASETTEHDAVQVVLYRLMVASRLEMEGRAGTCLNCEGSGKITVEELAGMTCVMDCPECSHLEED